MQAKVQEDGRIQIGLCHKCCHSQWAKATGEFRGVRKMVGCDLTGDPQGGRNCPFIEDATVEHTIEVQVRRTEYRLHTFTVKAKTALAAERMVLDSEVGDYDWHDSPIFDASNDIEGSTIIDAKGTNNVA